MTAKRHFPGIHARAKEMGLDQDTQRDWYERLTGKRNLTQMTEKEAALVAADFRKHASDRKGSGTMAERGDVRKIFVLWRKLGEAGALNDPSKNGLTKFIRSRFADSFGATVLHVHKMNDDRQIRAVIEALKDWCARVGVELKS